jgi:hypothetical protein
MKRLFSSASDARSHNGSAFFIRGALHVSAIRTRIIFTKDQRQSEWGICPIFPEVFWDIMALR